MLANKDFADFSQGIGLASIGLPEKELLKIATVKQASELLSISRTGYLPRYTSSPWNSAFASKMES